MSFEKQPFTVDRAPPSLYNAPVCTDFPFVYGGKVAVRSREVTFLLLILIIAGLALWIDFARGDRWFSRDVRTRLGLDLQGGTQVLLRAQDPNTPTDVMQTA